MKVIIKPTKEASKRTKERIKQHGPMFTKEGTDNTLSGEVWLLRSGEWLGWLPREELELIPMVLMPNKDLQVICG